MTSKFAVLIVNDRSMADDVCDCESYVMSRLLCHSQLCKYIVVNCTMILRKMCPKSARKP